MKRAIWAAGAAIVLAAGPAAAQELRIGFVNTTTGGGAVIGKQMGNGWLLGLEHQGWKKDGDKLGGVPTKIFYADDQVKPDVALQEVQKFLTQDKVQIVAGVIWSNVMMTIQKPVFDAKVLLLGTNAGPSPLAGPLCNKLFVSTSWANDDNHEAAGELVQREGIKTVVAMAANYQAGKDSISGFKRFYKGKIIETIYYKLGQTDFQADLAKVRALKPEAVFIFAPGAMGISFVKQWASSGLSKEMKLYSAFSIDYANLGAIGEAAVGSILPTMWNDDIKTPLNEKFVKDYVAKFGAAPSNFAAQAYDAPGLIAAAVKATGGKLDTGLLASAMRKNVLHSVRGDLKFNVNGFLIQPFYKAMVVKGGDGKLAIKTEGKIFERPDTMSAKCPSKNRI
ncbi:MAG: ABC transporter substrate-binding protein [Rhodospirillaceae bacterium]|nr:ABC transporter substrate-binding protein [Rhodospirillaceae bacterium]